MGRGEMLAALEQFVGGYMSNQMAIPANPGMAYGGMYGTAMPQSPYAQPAGGYPPNAMGGGGGYQSMQPMMQQGGGGMGGGGMGGGGGGMGMAMSSGGGGGSGGQKMSPGTLRMRGIPFRSSVEDVVRFFGGFQVRARPYSPHTSASTRHTHRPSFAIHIGLHSPYTSASPVRGRLPRSTASLPASEPIQLCVWCVWCRLFLEVSCLGSGMGARPATAM